MNREHLLEILEHLISELKEANLENPVIVEGEHDEKSLRAIGLKGEILKLNVGLSIINFCEKLNKYPEVIILTDWDRKGKELRDKLKHGLSANGIKSNDSYWLGLRHLCGREIKEIEYLHTFLKNLKKR